MNKNNRMEHLIECLIHVIGRSAVPLDEVRKIVGTGAQQVEAFNMCDGRQTQRQIARATKIDQGSLSRTFDRWVKNGVAFWVGEGTEKRLLHIYPIPESLPVERQKKKQRKK